jgi:hypothetical protein
VEPGEVTLDSGRGIGVQSLSGVGREESAYSTVGLPMARVEKLLWL